MKTVVQERLKVTPEEYQHLVFNVWFQWCSMKATKRQSLQKLLICQPLFKWWYRELQKMENHFIEETQFYEKVISKELALGLYQETVQPIYNRFSKPLIKKAYERNTIEKQN